MGCQGSECLRTCEPSGPIRQVETIAAVPLVVWSRHGARGTALTPLSVRLPWDFHPALTEERLRICARMLVDARRNALAMGHRQPVAFGRNAPAS